MPTLNDAVASTSGRIYSKEAILSYLLEQKQLQRERKEHDEVKAAALKEREKRAEVRVEVLAQETFKKAQLASSIQAAAGLRGGGGGGDGAHSSSSSSSSIDFKSDVKRKRLIDDSTDEERRQALKRVSPWLASCTPEVAPASGVMGAMVTAGASASASASAGGGIGSGRGSENSGVGMSSALAVITTITSSLPAPAAAPAAAPDYRPMSPFSKKPLRAKDLVPLNLQRDPDSSTGGSGAGAGAGTGGGGGGGGGGTVRYQCGVSRKVITSQRVICLVPSGVVMLHEVAEQLAFKDCVCPITSKKFKRDRDVLELLPAGTAFASSGNVQSKQYRPNMV